MLRQRAYNLRWATVPEDVIPLTAADPDFPCAPEIAEAITSFVSGRYLCYGPPQGLPDFKKTVANFFTGKRNVPAKPEYTMPVDSAAFGIYLTCKAFLNAGDEAIIFDPVDFLFRYSVEAVGATAIPFAIPPGTGQIDIEAFERLISPRTRLICLCNPLNPTGKVFSADELMLIGELACRYNLMILSDEIWSDIIFEPAAYTSIASLGDEIRNRTILVTGYSKSYGLAGLRIGTVAAFTQQVFDRVYDASLHYSTIHGANVLGQIAVVAALTRCDYWLKGFVTHLQRMRDITVKQLNNIPGISCIAPDGCYVAFANIKGTGKTSTEMQQLLFNDARVAIVPGLKQWFGDGAEGYIRLCFATSEPILTEALSRITDTLTR
ncbi:pyridoxal phosphate-dependent aminotransferase [Mucilaginibacter sp.]